MLNRTPLRFAVVTADGRDEYNTQMHYDHRYEVMDNGTLKITNHGEWWKYYAHGHWKEIIR